MYRGLDGEQKKISPLMGVHARACFKESTTVEQGICDNVTQIGPILPISGRNVQSRMSISGVNLGWEIDI